MLGASSLENNSIQFKRENSNEILIKFDCQETCLANKMIVSRSDGRKYFSAIFTKLLNEKAANKGILCMFSCKYNWFKNENGRKINTSHWRGCYNCVDKNCKLIYIGIIVRPCLNEMEVLIKFNGCSNHEKSIFISKIRCVGIEREKLAIKLVANGISNTRNEIIIDTGNFLKAFQI